MEQKYSRIYKSDSIVEIKEFGHHGELLQGIFEGDDGKLHRGLITLKCNLYASTAVFVKESNINEIRILPEGKVKALKAAQITLRYIGKSEEFGGYLIIHNDMPEEKGFGSSTSDVVAGIRAVAAAFNRTLMPGEIAKIAVEAERASDSIMFEECVLFAHREGKVIKRYNYLIPPMYIIGFDDNSGKGINTLDYKPAEYTFEEIKTFKVLKGLLERGLGEQDPKLIGKVATVSAKINQHYLPKPHFERIVEFANITNALGVQVAHSGTIMGILYPDYIDEKKKVAEVKECLKEINITKVWVFNTRSVKNE